MTTTDFKVFKTVTLVDGFVIKTIPLTVALKFDAAVVAAKALKAKADDFNATFKNGGITIGVTIDPV